MIVWLAIAAFFSAGDQESELDEVPLIAPRVATATRAQPEEPPPPRTTALFHVGALGMGAAGSGPQQGGGGAAIEVGVRFPFAGARLGLVLAPSLVGLAGSDASRRMNGTWVSVPLSVSYHEPLGPGALRFSAGAALDWVSANGEEPNGIHHDRYLSIGVVGTAGYVWWANEYASLVGEVGYHYLSDVVYGQTAVSHMVFLRVGYVLYR